MRIIFAAITHNETAAQHHAKLPALEKKPTPLYEHELVATLVAAYDKQQAAIEQHIATASQYPLAELTLLERAILLTAVSEMLAVPLTPPNVIINESIEIAKQFGSDKGYALINGILNTIAQNIHNA